MVNGHLSSEVDVPGIDSGYRQPKLLYRTTAARSGCVCHSGSGLTCISSRGAAVAELGTMEPGYCS
jgi:hypothetical protein